MSVGEAGVLNDDVSAQSRQIARHRPHMEIVDRSHMVEASEVASHLIEIERGRRNLHEYPTRLAKKEARRAEHKTTNDEGGDGVRAGPPSHHDDKACHEGADEPK